MALVLVALLAVLLPAAASPASAAAPPALNPNAVVAEAAKHKGKPYHYGSAGPSRFDCSGFTQYVFSRMGRKLPRSSGDQLQATQRISKSDKRPGDLIFITSESGRVYHTGVYAGNGKFWHSPKAGDRVKLATIFSSRYVVGRVR